MKTFADVKRRLVPGTRLVAEAHHFPEMVGTIRTVVSGTTVLTCAIEGHPRWAHGDPTFSWPMPKAGAVRILDEQTFEYDLPGKAGPVRQRFLP